MEEESLEESSSNEFNQFPNDPPPSETYEYYLQLEEGFSQNELVEATSLKESSSHAFNQENFVSKEDIDENVEEETHPKENEMDLSQFFQIPKPKFYDNKKVGSNADLYDLLFNTLGSRLSRTISGDFEKIHYPLKSINLELTGEEDDNIKTIDYKYEPDTLSTNETKKNLIKRCIHLKKMKLMQKVRNNLLHSLIAKYFINMKADYCLKEFEKNISKVKSEYRKKLQDYELTVRNRLAKEHKLTNQIQQMEKMRDEREKKVNDIFNDFQNYKASIGRELIYAKTGSKIPERLIDQLIHQHEALSKDLSKLRKTYIICNFVEKRKIDLINDLNQVPNTNRTLLAYEKMKVENKNFIDKLDEKEFELSCLRQSLVDTLQITCHIREKLFVLVGEDLKVLNEDREIIDSKSTHYRKQINQLKRERDNFRSLNETIENETGLLLQPILLRDFEHEKEEYSHLKVRLDSLKKQVATHNKEMKNARHYLESLKIEKAKIRDPKKYLKIRKTLLSFGRAPAVSYYDLKGFLPMVKKLTVSK